MSDLYAITASTRDGIVVPAASLAGAVLAYAFGRTSAPPPPLTTFPGDPGPGKLWYGQSIVGDNLSARETYYGHPTQSHRSYWQPTDVSSLIQQCVADIAAGRQPVVSTKLPASWAGVASGSQDAWINQLTGGLTGIGPVWLCLHHEPFDDATGGKNWTGSPGYDIADFVAMYAHFKPFCPGNVALMPIMQAAPFTPSVGGNANLTPWFGNIACDLFGFDSYNHWYVGAPAKKWRTVDECFGAFITQMSGCQPAIPQVLCEYGVRTDPTGVNNAVAWMQGAYTYCLQAKIKAMSYFDSSQNVNDGGTPWTLDYGGETSRLAQFKTDLLASVAV